MGPLGWLVCLGKALQAVVTSPAWGQLGAGLASPLQTVAGGCMTESSGCQGNIQRPQGPHRLSRKGTRPPEPLRAAFPVFPQLLCRRIVGGGGRRERRQGQQSWFPGRCSLCVVYLGDSAQSRETEALGKAGSVLILSIQRNPSPSLAPKSSMAPQHLQDKPTHLPLHVSPKAMLSSCNFASGFNPSPWFSVHLSF